MLTTTIIVYYVVVVFVVILLLYLQQRLFQNRVKLPDKFPQESRNLKLTNRDSILSHTKQSCFGTWNLEKVKVGGCRCIQVHSQQGNFWKKETVILYLNVNLNTILNTDINVALEQELCLPCGSSLSCYQLLHLS